MFTITKDVRAYFSEKYKDGKFFVSFKELSKIRKDEYLVEIKSKGFNFDKIKEDIYGGKDSITSIDAVMFNNDEMVFIEFKSGVLDKNKNKGPSIDNENTTQKCRNIRKEWWAVFEKKRYKEKELIILDVRIKMLESLNILNDKILINCNNTTHGISKIKFILVVDSNILVNPILATKMGNQKETVPTVYDEISKFYEIDKIGENLVFDEIDVMD